MIGTLAGLFVLMLSACDRPFVEVTTPGIEVLEPDLSTVLVDQRIEISVAASSFRPIEEVRLNGSLMTLNPDGSRWEVTYDLGRGLNRLVLEAFDIEGVAGVDTAYAVHLPFRFTLNAPKLPQGRGGHTATLMRSGGLLIVGGAARVNGPAHNEAFLLAPGGTFFNFATDQLSVARTGHTATRLPDGRILILGGSRTDNITTIDDLVETVEIYDPEAEQFSIVPFDGQPIRRALHTAVLRSTTDGGVFIDLYGGRGDIRYGTDPRLGTRRDLRTFELARDTLFALNTLNSAPFLEAAIAGHTETQLQLGPYFVFGSHFDTDFTDETSFRLEYNTPVGLLITDVPPMLTARTRHAAATLRGNLLMFFGGRQATPFDILNQTEVYSDQAQRFFKIPDLQQTVKRYGQTATNLSSQRILLVGGFGTDGNSFTDSEFFNVIPSN